MTKDCCKKKYSKKWLFLIPLIPLLFVILTTSGSPKYEVDALVYKTPSCGCCDIHARQLGRYYDTEIKDISNEELNYIKRELGIPTQYWSCHTTIINGKFIEGHIPFEVIEDFVNDNKELDGIALAGMPSGTPGMPGPKREEWVIYGFSDGEITVYRRI